MGFIQDAISGLRASVSLSGGKGRQDTSSRSDPRGYYNSRDDEEAYSIAWFHPAAANGQYSFYLQNTSTIKTLVISSIGLNADDLAKFKLWFVKGVVANGTSITPVNLNKHASNDAAASTALEDGGGTSNIRIDY